MAARPAGPLTPFLHHLGRIELLDRLELGPLGHAPLGELATALLDGRPADRELLATLIQRSGGNPFLFIELASALNAGRAGTEALVPSGVVEAVTDRRRRLPPLAGRVLEWLAVLPEPVSLRELALVEPAAASGALEQALDTLVSERLAAPLEDQGFRFAHAVVRDAVYQTLQRGKRARMHSAAAEALADAPTERRAPQLVAAGRTVEAARCYLELADQALLRSPLLEVRAGIRLGLVTGMARDSAEAMVLLSEAAERACEAGFPAEAGHAYLNLSFFADAAGNAEAAVDYAELGLAREDLPASIEVLLRGNLSSALADLGDLDRALAHQLAARAAATRLEPRLESRILVGLAHVHLLRGELDAARAALAGVEPTSGSFEYYRTLEQRALLLEAEGRLDEALARFLEGGAAADHPSGLWCLVGAVRTAAALGKLDAAADAARALARLRRRWQQTEWLHAEAAAYLASAEARAEDARRSFELAAARCPSRFHAARLGLEAARLRRDREGILAAIESFDSMGARGAADRARALARELGLRPGRRRRRVGTLSEREQQVAVLVATGKTNAEIGAQLYISPRTVERHVGAILQKLGYRSRVELAARVAAGELPGTPTG